ncbi:peptidase C65 Otubain-domain-containing protein [Dipodascopsis uninucleata]
MPEELDGQRCQEHDSNQLDDITILRLTQEIKDVEASKRPLVGIKEPISVLLDEYKDQTFRQKIESLGPTSSYRPVRGDGNCAWRAFAFCYFEQLRNLTKEQMESYVDHLKSRNSLLEQAGYSETGYIDFVDETFNVLSRLSDMSEDQLLAEFNNMEVSSAIIVHFRLLAAAYIKTHADDYIPFIYSAEGIDVADYCSKNIEAFSVEADHIALSALVNAFGTAELGVVYMDRNAGETVVHSFSPTEALNENLLKVDLLYRPGHYDIFYK